MFRSLRCCVVVMLCFFISNVKAQQWVYIPDQGFKNLLTWNGYDTSSFNAAGDSINANSYQVQNATTLTFYGSSVYDTVNFQGIEAFVNLKRLTVTYMTISNLPILPPNLRKLDLYNCDIYSLPTLPSGLDTLSVVHNEILSGLPPLPPGLKHLTCRWGQCALPATLPPSLRYLNCEENWLAVLPAVLPDSLEVLICNDIQIASLPTLTNTKLHTLQCVENSLVNLPALPSTLKTLYCGSNYGLHSLPQLPSGLELLECSYDSIEVLPTIPPTCKKLYISGNPITCLPYLPYAMEALTFDGTGIQCLPNSVTVTGQSNPNVQNIPICYAGNPNGCAALSNVSGVAVMETGLNCLLDTADYPLINLPLKVKKNGLPGSTIFTGLHGRYSLHGAANDSVIISVDTSNQPFVVACSAPDTNLVVLTGNDTVSFANNFLLSCPPTSDLVAQSVVNSTAFRAATSHTIKLYAGSATNFYGIACPAPLGTVVATISGPSHITWGNPLPTYISAAGDSAVWDAVDFSTSNLLSPYSVTMHTDTTAQVNSQICITLSVTPVTGDNDPSNNTTTQCFTVVSSYDPNDKQVSPPGDLPPYYDDWLTYTIRFQNTGTAEAFNIRVEDTMSQLLDISTFQLLSYSFPPQVSIDGNVVNFQFSNINLPDSNTNEPASHGFVQFRIKPLTALIPPQQVNNTGYIYFDFNPAVVTNTVTSEVVIPTSVNAVGNRGQAEAVVYPNPARDRWSVQLTGIGKNEAYDIVVTDMAGRVISSSVSNKGTASIQRNGAATGIYLMRITTAAGKVTVKKVSWE